MLRILEFMEMMALIVLIPFLIFVCIPFGIAALVGMLR